MLFHSITSSQTTPLATTLFQFSSTNSTPFNQSNYGSTDHLLSPEPSHVIEEESRNLAKVLWIYFGPCIFAIGIIGNLLIILVMGHSNMKGTSTCTYLKLMAVADILTLLTGMIPEWLEHMDILVLKEVHEVFCKLEKFVNFSSVDTSIWICVVFTVDRFIAVCFPMSETFLCPPSNAKFFGIVAFLVAIIKNVHILWTRGVEYEPSFLSQNGSLNVLTRPGALVSHKLLSNCGSPTMAFKHFEKYIRPWIAFVSISLIPCLVILICNIFIIRSLLILRFNRNKIPSDSENGNVLQMTVLCLTASICFMVCNTPSMIMLIGKPYWNGKHNKTYDLAKPIINQIFYVNHSINFFLYCITGKRFRQSLSLLCKSYKHPSFTYEISRQELLERASSRLSSRRHAPINSASFKASFHPFHCPKNNQLTDDKLITTALDEPKLNQITVSLSDVKPKRPQGDKANITADFKTTIDVNTTGVSTINNDNNNIKNGCNYFTAHNNMVTKNGTHLHSSTSKDSNFRT